MEDDTVKLILIDDSLKILDAFLHGVIVWSVDDQAGEFSYHLIDGKSCFLLRPEGESVGLVRDDRSVISEFVEELDLVPHRNTFKQVPVLFLLLRQSPGIVRNPYLDVL